jgi:hypothetical protein
MFSYNIWYLPDNNILNINIQVLINFIHTIFLYTYYKINTVNSTISIILNVQVNVTPYSMEIQAIDSNGMLFDTCVIGR